MRGIATRTRAIVLTTAALVLAGAGMMAGPGAAQAQTSLQPRIGFTVQPTTPVAGKATTFDASATRCYQHGTWSADNCTSYTWTDDGDPNPPLDAPTWALGTGRKASFTFKDAPWTVYLWLTVRDAAGRVSTAERTLKVAAAPVTDPTPTPSPSPSPSPSPTPTPPPSGADLSVAPNGNDAGTCTQSAPCQTLQRAFNVAKPGNVVEVAGGTYPAQKITGNKNDASDVVFRAAQGATVRVGQSGGDCPDGLRIYASHVTVQGFKQLGAACVNGEPDAGARQSDVTLLNDHAATFLVDSATDVNVKGGDYGGGIDGTTYSPGNSGIRRNGSTLTSNVTIDGARFHDIHCDASNPDCHIECLIVGGVNNLIVRNSTFDHCAIFDMFLEGFNGPISNVLMENNFFADATEGTGGGGTGRTSVGFKPNTAFSNVLVRFNSAKGVITFGGSGPTLSNVRVVGNAVNRTGQAANECNSQVQWAYNVVTGRGCSGQDKVVGSLGWANPTSDANLDYHLLSGSPAIDAVPNAGADESLGVDIDGDHRPAGSQMDAGADERP